MEVFKYSEEVARLANIIHNQIEALSSYPSQISPISLCFTFEFYDSGKDLVDRFVSVSNYPRISYPRNVDDPFPLNPHISHGELNPSPPVFAPVSTQTDETSLPVSLPSSPLDIDFDDLLNLDFTSGSPFASAEAPLSLSSLSVLMNELTSPLIPSSPEYVVEVHPVAESPLVLPCSEVVFEPPSIYSHSPTFIAVSPIPIPSVINPFEESKDIYDTPDMYLATSRPGVTLRSPLSFTTCLPRVPVFESRYLVNFPQLTNSSTQSPLCSIGDYFPTPGSSFLTNQRISHILQFAGPYGGRSKERLILDFPIVPNVSPILDQLEQVTIGAYVSLKLFCYSNSSYSGPSMKTPPYSLAVKFVGLFKSEGSRPAVRIARIAKFIARTAAMFPFGICFCSASILFCLILNIYLILIIIVFILLNHS